MQQQVLNPGVDAPKLRWRLSDQVVVLLLLPCVRKTLWHNNDTKQQRNNQMRYVSFGSTVLQLPSFANENTWRNNNNNPNAAISYQRRQRKQQQPKRDNQLLVASDQRQRQHSDNNPNATINNSNDNGNTTTILNYRQFALISATINYKKQSIGIHERIDWMKHSRMNYKRCKIRVEIS